MRTRHFSSSNPVSSRIPLTTPRGSIEHRPVLLHEVVSALNIQPDDVVVDATIGGGGHAIELVKGLGGNGLFVGFDLDADAIKRAQRQLSTYKGNTHLIEANFRNLGRELKKRGVTKITKALFDLGWSSQQLNSGRGFSFTRDEPLVMTYAKYGSQTAVSAATIVNEWKEESIADVIFGFGEERFSRRIAKAIVMRRAKKPFATSRELAETIAVTAPRRGKIHPATKTFQALRIAVNDELGALEEGLAAAWKLLAVSGRIAVITFHSVEDRIVKQKFFAWQRSGEGRLLFKKPSTATREELRTDKSARSAKLRVLERISYEGTYPQNK